MTKAEQQRVWLLVPVPLLEKINVLVQKGYYRDEKDFIIDAIREKIEYYETHRPELFK